MSLKEVKNKLTRQAKREIRRAQIIDATLKILAMEGSSRFTMRNVSDKSGVTLGGVQYYFRNKSDLLVALTEYKLKMDLSATEDTLKKSTLSPEAEFTSFINLLLQDNKKPLIYGLDFQLFALSCSNKTAEKCVDKFYQTIRQWIEGFIQALNPKLSESECSRRAIVILSITEGLMQVLYRDRRNKPDFSEVEDMVREETLRIAKAP